MILNSHTLHRKILVDNKVQSKTKILALIKQNKRTAVRFGYYIKDKILKNLLNKRISKKVRILKLIEYLFKENSINESHDLPEKFRKIEKRIEKYQNIKNTKFYAKKMLGKIEKLIKYSFKINIDLENLSAQEQLELFRTQKFFKYDEDIVPFVHRFYEKYCLNIYSFILSKNQRYLYLGCGDFNIRKLYLDNCKVVIYYGHLDKVMCLAYDEENDIIISGSKDRRIIFWNCKTDSIRKVINYSFGISFLAVDFKKRKMICSESLSTKSYVLDYDSGDVLRCIGFQNDDIDKFVFRLAQNYLHIQIAKTTF